MFFRRILLMNPYVAEAGYRGELSKVAFVTAARLLVAPFVYPFENARRRMMVDPKASMLSIWKSEGLLSLFSGFWVEFSSNIIGTLIFIGYDLLLKRKSKK